MEKTIVYCKSIKDCGRLFMHFKVNLGNDSFHKNKVHSKNLLFAMYHHSTLSKNQSQVLDSFLDEEGTCRLIFATNALGMGVNFPNVRHIILYGPPREMEELVQQVGRAGRDWEPATALLMFNGQKTRNCDQQIKNLCNDTGCLREMMLADFDVSNFPNFKTHKCCINCHMECLCDKGKLCREPLPVINLNEGEEKPVMTREVSHNEMEVLREILEDYKEEFSTEFKCFLGVDGRNLFVDALTKKVLKHCKFIFDKAYILENLPVFTNSQAMDILCMMNDVFQDVDKGEIDIDQCARLNTALNMSVDELDISTFLEELSDDYEMSSDDNSE
ncbi:Bloom syndrome protein-like [Stylophora pistillata]|nr:Bloom syndrome protein-like [Stylophora pistillata]